MTDAVRALLALPRGRQLPALETLCAELGQGADEEWNTRFGPESLFAAWTATPVAQGVYAANRPLLPRAGRVIEVGGGDGSLWAGSGFTGELVLYDPVPEVHQQVAKHVQVTSHVDVVGTDLPSADLVVCSMTLHHVAGRDADERARWGFDGPGKVEILRAMGQAAPRILLNEANIHCELDLAPGDPLLGDNLLDSYVRRCGHCVADLLEARPDSPFAARWRHILHRWCLDQVLLYKVSRRDRDVYELDVRGWLACFDAAGLEVESARCTDDYGLFWQYVLRPQ